MNPSELVNTHLALAVRAARISAESAVNAVGVGVESPCISLCKMDAASGYCQGCLRTLDEIAAWSKLNGEGKRRIWGAILTRTTLLKVSS